MLEMKPKCESCSVDLAPASRDACICSYECTFCAECTATRFKYICPNCGGELVPRPTRDAGGI